MQRDRSEFAVTRVTADGVDKASEVLARAFADDPLVLWPMRSDIDPYEGVLLQLEPLARGYAEIGVLWECDGDAGVAAWLPPGMADRVAPLWDAAKSELGSVFDDDGVRYSAQWDWMAEHVPDEPAWFLDIVGVDPAAQGSGVGSALVAHGIERSQADGHPAFLETSIERNVAYYERFGFRVLEEGDAPLGGPHVWFMRRDPVN